MSDKVPEWQELGDLLQEGFAEHGCSPHGSCYYLAEWLLTQGVLSPEAVAPSHRTESLASPVPPVALAHAGELICHECGAPVVAAGTWLDLSPRIRYTGATEMAALRKQLDDALFHQRRDQEAEADAKEEAEALRARLATLEAVRQAAQALVDKIWTALGFPHYENDGRQG